MQRVVVRTITTLLSGPCDADCLHFCALAAKNLTVLDNVRAYLDDQVSGIAIDILERLGSGGDDTVILCTATIFNCVAQKQSRLRATDKNLVAECQRLISVCGADAQHSCTVLLAELSKHSDVAYRLLDGGIMDIFSSNLSASDSRSGEMNIYRQVKREHSKITSSRYSHFPCFFLCRWLVTVACYRRPANILKTCFPLAFYVFRWQLLYPRPV